MQFKKKNIFKGGLIGFTWLVYFGLMDAFMPVMTTEIAMTQMNSSIDSFSSFRLFQSYSQFLVLVPITISVLIIKSIIKNK